MPGDAEPAGVSVHGGDRDIDGWVRLQDSITLKCLGSAGLAPSTVGDTQGHDVQRVVSLWDCQLAGELLRLRGVLARLLEVFHRTADTKQGRGSLSVAALTQDRREERAGVRSSGSAV